MKVQESLMKGAIKLWTHLEFEDVKNEDWKKELDSDARSLIYASSY